MRFKIDTRNIGFPMLMVLAFSLAWQCSVGDHSEGEASSPEEAPLFDGIVEEDIVSVLFQEKGKAALLVEKYHAGGRGREPEWGVRSPVKTKADRYVMQSIVRSLRDLPGESTADKGRREKTDYGLSEPQFSIRFTCRKDSAERGIDFGQDTPEGGSVFARILGDNRVYVVPLQSRDSLRLDLFDVRDKYMCDYDGQDICGITLVSGYGSFDLVQREEQWYLMPEGIRASPKRVSDYFNNVVRWIRFVEVIEERGKSFSRYGLDQPRLILVLKLKDGSDFSFLVGMPNAEDQQDFFYATRSSDYMVFKVQADLIFRLITTGFELMERRIFDFESSAVRAVDLKHGGAAASLARERDGWKVKGSTQNLEQQEAVVSLIDAFVSAEYEDREPLRRIDDGYPAAAFHDPRWTVVLHFDNPRPPVTVWLTEVEEATDLLWLSPDRGETAYHVSGDLVSGWPASLEGLQLNE